MLPLRALPQDAVGGPIWSFRRVEQSPRNRDRTCARRQQASLHGAGANQGSHGLLKKHRATPGAFRRNRPGRICASVGSPQMRAEKGERFTRCAHVYFATIDAVRSAQRTREESSAPRTLRKKRVVRNPLQS